jgi:hypothetical protein
MHPADEPSSLADIAFLQDHLAVRRRHEIVEGLVGDDGDAGTSAPRRKVPDETAKTLYEGRRRSGYGRVQ